MQQVQLAHITRYVAPQMYSYVIRIKPDYVDIRTATTLSLLRQAIRSHLKSLRELGRITQDQADACMRTASALIDDAAKHQAELRRLDKYKVTPPNWARNPADVIAALPGDIQTESVPHAADAICEPVQPESAPNATPNRVLYGVARNEYADDISYTKAYAKARYAARSLMSPAQLSADHMTKRRSAKQIEREMKRARFAEIRRAEGLGPLGAIPRAILAKYSFD